MKKIRDYKVVIYFIWLVIFSCFSVLDALFQKQHYLQIFMGIVMIFWAILFRDELK